MSGAIEALVSGGASGFFTAFLYKVITDQISVVKTEWLYKHSLALDVVSTLSSTIQTYNALRVAPNKLVVGANGVVARSSIAQIFSSRVIATPVLKAESIIEKIRDAELRRWVMLYYHALDTLKAASLASEGAYTDLIMLNDTDAENNVALEMHRIETFNTMQDRMLVYAFMSAVYGVQIVRNVLGPSGGYDYFQREKYELMQGLSERYRLTPDGLAKLVSSLSPFDGKTISVDDARAFFPLTLGTSPKRA